MNECIVPLIHSKRSTVFSNRITSFLAEEIGVPIVTDDELIARLHCDVLYLINGPMAFCGYLSELSEAVRGATQVVWVQNDYTLPPPAPVSDAQSPFRKVFADRKLTPHYWSTVEKNWYQTPGSYRVDWNMLAAHGPWMDISEEYAPGLVYYGAYRQNRVKSFNRFMNSESIAVSSTSKHFKNHPGVALIPPVENLIPWLNKCGFALFLEDEKSKKEYHSAPTRLYEMLRAGVPILFDETCKDTLIRSGFDVSEWTISSPEEYRKFDRMEVAWLQREAWRRDYLSHLRGQVNEAYKRVHVLD